MWINNPRNDGAQATAGGGDQRNRPEPAGADLVRHLDDDIRAHYRDRILPWERNVEVGRIDYWHIHAYALDELPRLLAVVLPDGHEMHDASWRGRHDERSPWIIVSALSGSWSEPRTGKHRNDLISLVAHVYRTSLRQAAIKLARNLGIEAVRHV